MPVKNLQKKYEPDVKLTIKAADLWDLANELDKKDIYPWTIGEDEEDYSDCEYGDEAWLKYFSKRVDKL